MSISKYTIYGERCSGTNYLQNVMSLNFETELTWEHGQKHFFGYNDNIVKDSDDTLFICVVRDIHKWINSLFNDRFHLPIGLSYFCSRKYDIHNFLNKEFYSVLDPFFRNEIMEDRNIITKQRYKNIFEMRHTKLEYMIEELPKKVKHYIFIRYEDLVDNFEQTMCLIRDKGLKVNDDGNFPINSKAYKNFSSVVYIPNRRRNHISKKIILENPNLIKYYEEKLGYIDRYKDDADYDTPVYCSDDWVRFFLLSYLVPAIAYLLYVTIF